MGSSLIGIFVHFMSNMTEWIDRTKQNRVNKDFLASKEYHNVVITIWISYFWLNVTYFDGLDYQSKSRMTQGCLIVNFLRIFTWNNKALNFFLFYYAKV